jgi:GTPase SAR1 family protein
MIPLLVLLGLGAVGAKLLLSDENERPARRRAPRTPLKLNLARLPRLLDGHPGARILIIGQPGAGKSSLLHLLSRGRCTPPPVIGPQTDATDWSRNPDIVLLHNLGGTAIVDAPGFGTERHPVRLCVRLFPFWHFDKIVFVAKGKFHQGDIETHTRLRRKLITTADARRTSVGTTRLARWVQQGGRLFLVRTFAESLTAEERETVRTDYHQQLPGAEDAQVFFVSNRTEAGIDELRAALEL